ncbi:MAG TPA: hypothetical protein VFN01_07945 [Marinobacter sp.]|uniref:hypothetical protein n=1 Tax=Marinobacter sp. TaxID=50741 RepID=UPI002D8116DD|nr:hypothetical protein [Marinobacter sp.]HET8801100.1 hypothetical protein [Marinobacter sp.]
MKMIAMFLAALVSLLAGCQTVTTEPVAYSEDSESNLFDPETFERYGSIVVAAGTPEKPVDMRLWYTRPDKLTANTPVVLVMHGGRRDADVYRDFWGAYANEYNVLIVAPEISEEDFPTGWGYQTGNWVTPDSSSVDATKGHRNPPEQSSFAAVERAFDKLREAFALEDNEYDIWGHGSGAQFVTRMVMLYPQARIGTAVAANSGTYTFPDWSLPLRYGLKNTGIDEEDLKPAYAHHLVIMLGTADNDPSHRLLSKLDIAIAQGAHRLEKGKNFYAANKAKAEELGTEFNWELETVYGIGHSGQAMSVAGARYLLAGEKERALFPLDDDSDSEESGESREKNELLQGSGAEDDPFADMD